MVKTVKNVDFFDWQLNKEQPVSWVMLEYCLKHSAALPDIHSAIHLGIVLSGENPGIYAGHKITLHPGDFYLTAPWEPHCSLCSSNSRKILLINLDCNALQASFFRCSSQLAQLWMMPPPERMQFINHHTDRQQLIDLLTGSCAKPEVPEKILLVWNSVVRFFIEMLPAESAVPENTSNSYQRLLPALKMLGGKLLSTEQAAELCGMSPGYFAAVFKSLFGLSFGKYERTYRLNCAADAVLNGATLKEAAANWGFCDKSHLSRLLKQKNRS